MSGDPQLDSLLTQLEAIRWRQKVERLIIDASLTFLREEMKIMAVTTQAINDAVDKLSGEVTLEGQVLDAVITLIKARPSEAEMQAILDKLGVASTQAETDTAAGQAVSAPSVGSPPAPGGTTIDTTGGTDVATTGV